MTHISPIGWLLIVALVIVGGALEYFWMVGFRRVDQRWDRKRKAILGGVLIGIAVAGLSYAIVRSHSP